MINSRRRLMQRLLSSIAVCACICAHAAESSEIARILQRFVDQQEIAGAVTLVATKDSVLSLEAMGFADIAAQKPMLPDALFWIASLSKPITATALMMLVDEGKVRLEGPVEQYLPKFTPQIMKVNASGTHVLLQRPDKAITVRQLLSHESGLPFSTSFESPTLDASPLALQVESYALTPLLFEPGTGLAYSNAGINTAARMVEVVSGMRFEDFLQSRLFGPLGMQDTTFWPSEAQAARLAKSYRPNAAKADLEEIVFEQLRYPLTDRTRRYAVPAAGLFSTASDLQKFCRMILSGGTLAGKRYVSEAAIREMLSDRLNTAKHANAGAAEYRNNIAPMGFDGAGLGWVTSASGAFGAGGASGTVMKINPARGLITIWLVQGNGSWDKAFPVFEEIAVQKFGTR